MQSKKQTLDEVMGKVRQAFYSLAKFKLQSLEADEPLNFSLICDAEKKIISAHNDLNDVSF